MVDHFFVHLPSNSSESYYPNNTRAHYITRLLNSVELQGNWECGLSEILFSKTWHNVKSGEGIIINCIDCTTKSSSLNDDDYKALQYHITISDGSYSGVEELVNELNRQIMSFAEYADAPLTKEDIRGDIFTTGPPVINWPKFSYNYRNNKVEVRLKKGLQVTLSDGLCRLLGFRKKSMPIKANDLSEYGLVAADRTADVNDGLEAFYVYCDILESIHVGDTLAPLLRIVNSGSEKQGTLVRRHYENPIYVPVQKKNFEQIEIQLVTDRGRPVPFERGRVILTLHFRKSRDNYFM